MQSQELVTWVRVHGSDDPDDTINVCHYCAITGTEIGMECEIVKATNDLEPGDTLRCELCGCLLAEGRRI